MHGPRLSCACPCHLRSNFKKAIAELQDTALAERFPDREGGLLVPNHTIADLKTLAADHTALEKRLEEAEAVIRTAYRQSELQNVFDAAKTYLDKHKPARAEGEEDAAVDSTHPFNRLRWPREKWDTWKKQKGTFHCPNCDNRSKPERCSPFPGATLHCGECEYELTRRTGGGQSDPFGWIFKAVALTEAALAAKIGGEDGKS